MSERRELHCEDCDLDYSVWYADNELWNAVMRPAGYLRELFLCARCFLIRADKAGFVNVARVSVSDPAPNPRTRAEVLAATGRPPESKYSDALDHRPKSDPAPLIDARQAAEYVIRLRKEHGGPVNKRCDCDSVICNVHILLRHIDSLKQAYESKVSDLAEETARNAAEYRRGFKDGAEQNNPPMKGGPR